MQPEHLRNVLLESPAVLQQRDRLRTEVEALQSRLQSLQAAANTTMGAKTDLQGQLSDAQAALAAKEAELVQARSALQAYKAAADASDAAAAAAAGAQQAAALQKAQAAAESAQQQLEAAQQQLKERETKVGTGSCVTYGPLQKQQQQTKLPGYSHFAFVCVLHARMQLRMQPTDRAPSSDFACGQQPTPAQSLLHVAPLRDTVTGHKTIRKSGC
jgi:hypothetical protein